MNLLNICTRIWDAFICFVYWFIILWWLKMIKQNLIIDIITLPWFFLNSVLLFGIGIIFGVNRVVRIERGKLKRFPGIRFKHWLISSFKIIILKFIISFTCICPTFSPFLIVVQILIIGRYGSTNKLRLTIFGIIFWLRWWTWLDRLKSIRLVRLLNSSF